MLCMHMDVLCLRHVQDGQEEAEEAFSLSHGLCEDLGCIIYKIAKLQLDTSINQVLRISVTSLINQLESLFLFL